MRAPALCRAPPGRALGSGRPPPARWSRCQAAAGARWPRAPPPAWCPGCGCHSVRSIWGRGAQGGWQGRGGPGRATAAPRPLKPHPHAPPTPPAHHPAKASPQHARPRALVLVPPVDQDAPSDPPHRLPAEGAAADWIWGGGWGTRPMRRGRGVVGGVEACARRRASVSRRCARGELLLRACGGARRPAPRRELGQLGLARGAADYRCR